MKTIEEFNFKELIFDSNKNNSSSESINLQDDTLEINFNSIITTQFTGGNIGEKFQQLKDKLKISVYTLKLLVEDLSISIESLETTEIPTFSILE